MLNKITIRNYKSLEDVSLTLRPFNVFVGPNNAGKSNIFDCLMFLSESLRLGAPAISSRGGFHYIVWGGDLKRAISIDLDASVVDPASEGKRRFNYQLEIVGGPMYYLISKVKLACEVNSEWRLLVNVQSGQGTVWDIDGKEVRRIEPGQDPSWWLNVIPQLWPHLTLFNYIIGWKLYNLVPSRMRQPQPVKKDLILQPQGDNLSVVLHSLHSSYRREFREIEELLRTSAPELEELRTELTELGQTFTTYKERGHPLNIPIWAMPDGTLRFLGHLAVACSPTPPPLVCFEEPENHLHPRLHEHLLAILKSLSKRTQVLIATHSPLFLDSLRKETGDLIVVDKVEGKTRCRRVSRKRALKDALNVLGLGEIWYSGSIGGVAQR